MSRFEKMDPRGFWSFIPAWMDDAGWTAAEFRVYAHLSRRIGKKASAFPAIKSISRKCRLHKDTVCKCLKSLERQGFLKRSRKKGHPNNYYIYTPAELSGTNQLPLVDGEGRRLAGKEGQGVAESEGHKGIERKGIKGKGRVATTPQSGESEKEWVARLQALHLGIGISAELEKARRKKRDFERAWFEQHWLPKCTPRVGVHTAPCTKTADMLVYGDAPEGGMEWVRARYPVADFETWGKVPIDVRQKFAAERLAAEEKRRSP